MDVSNTQKGKQGMGSYTSVGRFPREKASSEPGFKGPMEFIKQTEWELRAVSRQREQHVQRPSKKTVSKVEYSVNFKSSSHYGYKPR